MIDALSTLFHTGGISVIAIVVLWALTLLASSRSPRPRQSLKAMTPNAVSGTALLAAFGLAMREAPLALLATLLAISLLAFLLDLRIRLYDQACGLRRRTE